MGNWPYQSSIDEEICFKIQNGDEAFINDIQRAYAYGYGGYKKIIGDILRNPSDAEECENDMLKALWAHFVKDPTPPKNLRSYVRVVAANMARTRYKQNKNKKIDQTELDDGDDIPSKINVENIVMTKELANEIGIFIRDIQDPVDRKILIYRWFKEKSIQEIATITGINYNTVNTKINRYRRKMAAYLIERGFIQ